MIYVDAVARGVGYTVLAGLGAGTLFVAFSYARAGVRRIVKNHSNNH